MIGVSFNSNKVRDNVKTQFQKTENKNYTSNLSFKSSSYDNDKKEMQLYLAVRL